ncbi:MAG: NADH:ubiquinone reductase (Na(+)-transporting) subunit C [Rikenellaceae bacterium]
MATNKYICKVCGHVHEGDAAPALCPVCKVPASDFELEKPKKSGLFGDKNSNAYIITYSTIMVVIVAFFLAFTAVSLRERQAENVLNEKKNAILASLGESDKSYDELISAFAIDVTGEKVDGIEGEKVLDLLADLKSTFAGDVYPIFQTSDGRVVVPIFGSGLWNSIWGYVALESDMNTISGVVLDHAGETPGLGAEIATAKHQAQYVGKTIFEGDDFVSITLIKGGAKGDNIAHEVDGISGGTKTADGVTEMFSSSLAKYIAYLKAQSSVNNVNPQDNE